MRYISFFIWKECETQIAFHNLQNTYTLGEYIGMLQGIHYIEILLPVEKGPELLNPFRYPNNIDRTKALLTLEHELLHMYQAIAIGQADMMMITSQEDLEIYFQENKARLFLTKGLTPTSIIKYIKKQHIFMYTKKSNNP